MKRAVALIAILAGLSGCLSDQMNKGLSFMVGQNIQYAVARLGYPDAQRTMLGDTIYVWGTSRDVDVPMTTSSSTYGTVGSTPYSGTTYGTTFVRANLNCTIQLGTTPDGTIKTWQWNGNMAGCMQYARRLGG
jgi:hypothetical protein